VRQRDAQTLSPQMREAIRVAIASGAPTVLQSRDDGSLVVTRIASGIASGNASPAPSAPFPAPLTRPAAFAPPRPAARPIALVR